MYSLNHNQKTKENLHLMTQNWTKRLGNNVLVTMKGRNNIRQEESPESDHLALCKTDTNVPNWLKWQLPRKSQIEITLGHGEPTLDSADCQMLVKEHKDLSHAEAPRLPLSEVNLQCLMNDLEARWS